MDQSMENKLGELVIVMPTFKVIMSGDYATLKTIKNEVLYDEWTEFFTEHGDNWNFIPRANIQMVTLIEHKSAVTSRSGRSNVDCRIEFTQPRD